MTLDEFIGMTRSSTKMRRAMRRLSESRAIELLRAEVAPYASGLAFRLPHRAELFLARRIERD